MALNGRADGADREDVSTATRAARPAATCPIRPGEPCTLCQLDVTGPQDCPLVYLVMGDDELREGVHQTRLAVVRSQRPRPAAGRAAAHPSPAGS
ncbi:hypothetical protein DLJ46_14020 [Micromonospora globispora]|uniref:Uncharacterized protein n=1 Tax=Micromonospora globispora TaxID=1450148 RepID=A0A317K3E7_9ACTN|nr:hypothetical protein DLJ46_14020 [Micromonospora globispora]RQW98614.1 hypothetical protein DKL51_10160 [Micromonospora globispora]